MQAIFGDPDHVDAFTGMVSEPHVPGSEFGELQLAMWTSQFEALRDGDRFFFGNDAVLDEIATTYGVDYRRTLAEVIAANSDVALGDLPANVFRADGATQVAAAEPGAAPSEMSEAAETLEVPAAESRSPRDSRAPEGTRRPAPRSGPATNEDRDAGRGPVPRGRRK